MEKEQNTEEALATRKAFADSARDLLSRADQHARIRLCRASSPSFARDTWSQAALAGWFSIVVPESEGGLGMGLAEVAAVVCVAGEYLCAEPIVSAGMLPAVLLRLLPGGTRRDALLASLSKGDVIAGVAWQKSAGQMEPIAESATLASVDGRKLLNGSLCFVEPGPGAQGWIVLAAADSRTCAVWIAADSSGLTLTPQRRVDGQLVAKLDFSNVIIRDEDVLAVGKDVRKIFATALDAARLLQAEELCGVARRALDITLEYVKTRTQFGRPIGSFQALQHRLVDAALQLELTDATLAEIHARSDPWPSAALASRAKARAAQTALSVTRLGIQLHGAMGNTDECEIGLYLKRTIALSSSLGGASANRQRFLSLSGESLHGQSSQEIAGLLPRHEDWEAMSDAEFRHVIRDFLQKNYPAQLRHLPRPAFWHEVSSWYSTLSRRGWVAPAWPRQFGGMGLSAARLMAYHDEIENYGAARWIDNAVEMLGPLLIRFGTDEQRNKYLPKILTGENRWCQGYSEPNAGSDLASLKTFAELEGEHFRVNGRKIWTSHAQDATHIFMLVRTDRTAKPGAAISFLLAEMNSPGISLRPIQDLAGDTPFCEVTFDDVIVPANQLVGELNGGWSIAKALLGFERLFIANPAPVVYAMTQLTRLAQARGLFADTSFAARYAELALDIADFRALYNRFADMLKRGEQPGAEISMLKVCSTETWQRVAFFLSEVAAEQGALPAAQMIEGEPLQLLSPVFNSVPSTIYGGSNEIQRNILAKQVLCLPG